MKLLMFAAALRKDSSNKKLIRIAAEIAGELKCQTDLAEMSEFNVPLYDGDLQQTAGLPAGAKLFIERFKQADGLIISSPEYNFSTPGILKNLIDWASRDTPNPFRHKHILLMSASPSLVGGNRGLWATRIPLEACGAFVFPDMFSLANSYQAFAENGKLQDEKLLARLRDNLTDFIKALS